MDERLRKLGAALRNAPGYGRAVGYRYHDGRPSIIEGLLSRGDRRVAAVIRAAWAGRGLLRRLERVLLVRAVGAVRRRGAGRRAGGPGLVHHPGAGLRRSAARGTTWTPGWTGTGCGRTGRTRSTRPGRPRWKIAGGPRVMTAGCARRWEPRYRRGRPARSCCR